VILIDCTYKSNRYRLPLVDIVGVSCHGTSFFIAHAFIREEDEDTFRWVVRRLLEALGFQPNAFVVDLQLALINALKSLSHSRVLVCRWHINKNVLAHYVSLSTGSVSEERRNNIMAMWADVYNARTENDFVMSTTRGRRTTLW